MAPKHPEPQPDDLSQLLTPSELARRLGLPVKRIRLAIRQGDLAAYSIGAWRRVRVRDAEEWLSRHRYDPCDGGVGM